MKNLSYKEYDFLYSIFDCTPHGIAETTFYENKPRYKNRRKYYIFGPKIEVKYYKKLFILDYDIENPKYNKDDIRKDLDNHISYIERQREIEKGEIV